MKFKWKRVVFFLILFLYSVPVHAASWNSSAGSIDSTVGFNDYIKPGKYTPVQIHLNGSYAMLSGSVELSVPTGEQDYYLYQKQFVPNPFGVTVEFYIPTSCTNNHMTVSLLNAKGNTVDTKTLSYDISYMEARMFVGVLSGQYSDIDYWNQLHLSDNNIKGYSQQLFSSQLPDNALSLDMLDMIMIDHFPVDQISSGQWDALFEWISNGGILLCGSGAENIQTYLPDTLFLPSTASLPVVNRTLSWYSHGQGRIFLADFPLSDLSDYFYNNSDKTSELTSTLFGEEKLTAVYQDQFGYSTSLQDTAIQQTTQVQASQHLNLWVYAAVLLFYILVLLPIAYFFLKRKDLLQYLRVFITVSAFAFSGIIFFLGSNTRFSYPFMNYISIQTYEDGQKVETVYTGIQAPYNQTYTVSIDNDYDVIPLQQSRHWNTSGYASARNHTVTMNHQGGDTLLSFHNLVAFSTRNFLLERSTPLKDGQSVESSVSFYSGKISGTVQNHLGTTLSNAILALPGHITKLGTMADGQQATLEHCDSHLYQDSSYCQLSDLRSIVADQSLSADMTEKRIDLLSYFLQLCDSRQETNGFLIGFTDSDSNFQKDTSYSANGLTLAVIPIEVNEISGNLQYFPILPAQSSVMSGEFSDSAFPVLESEYGTMNYQFYSGFQPEQLDLIFAADATDSPPVSEVYFYKPSINSYIQVYPGQTTFSSVELKNYLSEDNSLLIKYHANALGAYLPRITSIGRISYADSQ